MTEDDTLYEAERPLVIQGWGEYLHTEEEAQEFLDTMMASIWFWNRHAAVARRPIRVKFSNHVQALSSFESRTIYLPPWSHNTYVLIHELAHFCAVREWPRHGLRYRQALVGLVGRFMDPEAGRRLRYSMMAHGLEI